MLMSILLIIVLAMWTAFGFFIAHCAFDVADHSFGWVLVGLSCFSGFILLAHIGYAVGWLA